RCCRRRSGSRRASATWSRPRPCQIHETRPDMTEVVFPRLSEKEPDAEGVLATWFVSDGDHVAGGQLLGAGMGEDAAGEVLAPAAGEVRLLVGEDQRARQGEVIAGVD